MKKTINILLIFIVVLTWRYHFTSQTKKINKYNEHLKKADTLYKMKANLDAYKEYEKTEKFMDETQGQYILSQKIKILLEEDEIAKARKVIDQAYLENIDISKISNEFLNYCIKNEKYKQMNDFILIYSDKINLKEFEDKIFGQFQALPGRFSQIHQVGEKMHLVSNNSKQFIIDDNARKIFTSYYDKIIGFDEQNKLLTVKIKDENYLVDFEKNIRAKFEKGDISHYAAEAYIQKNKIYILRNRLNEELIKGDYISNQTNDHRLIIDKGKLKILDKNLNTKQKLSVNKLKINPNNDAIFNDTIVIKKDKMRLYNIKNMTYSKFYDDIDFNYGKYIAVKKNDKWAYVDSDFQEVTDFIYDKAKSFSNKIGFVTIKKQSYFIDEKFKTIRKCNFTDFTGFNDKGVAFIKENGLWTMIKLVKEVN